MRIKVAADQRSARFIATRRMKRDRAESATPPPDARRRKQVVSKVDADFLRKTYYQLVIDQGDLETQKQKKKKEEMTSSSNSSSAPSKSRKKGKTEETPTIFESVGKARPAKCRRNGRKKRKKSLTPLPGADSQALAKRAETDNDIRHRLAVTGAAAQAAHDDQTRAVRVKRKKAKRSQEAPSTATESENSDSDSECESCRRAKSLTAEAVAAPTNAVLEMMHAGNCFDGALSGEECDQLAKYFVGQAPFNRKILELLDRGMTKAVERLKASNPSMNAAVANFLSKPVKAKSFLVDKIIADQAYLPLAWGGRPAGMSAEAVPAAPLYEATTPDFSTPPPSAATALPITSRENVATAKSSPSKESIKPESNQINTCLIQ